MAIKYSIQYSGVPSQGNSYSDGIRGVNATVKTDNIVRLGTPTDPTIPPLAAGDQVLVSKLNMRDIIQELFLVTTGTIQIGTLANPSLLYNGTATGAITIAAAYWLTPLETAMDLYITVAGANDLKGYIRYSRN
jgi:hypothetical protein